MKPAYATYLSARKHIAIYEVGYLFSELTVRFELLVNHRPQGQKTVHGKKALALLTRINKLEWI